MPRHEVLVQLDDELEARLDEIAQRKWVSRSELLRRGALSVIGADNMARADDRLIECYTSYPPDPLLLETSRRLAAETPGVVVRSELVFSNAMPERGTSTLDKTEPRTGQDDDGLAHIVMKRDQMRGYVSGQPIKALCGKVWVPSRDYEGLPLCPRCSKERDRLLAGMKNRN